MSQRAKYPGHAGLVKREPGGDFYVEGVDLSTLSPELYSCIWKLKECAERLMGEKTKSHPDG